MLNERGDEPKFLQTQSRNLDATSRCRWEELQC